MASLIYIAQEYADNGFGVIPCNNNKSPKLPTGHNFLYEIMQEADIEKYFVDAEKIGIACGYVSDGFECIDFDAHGGQNIDDIFNRFISDNTVKYILDTYNLPIIKTAGGGYHIYFKNPYKYSSRQVFARWADGGVMIESRAHGSYVVTVPSQGYKHIRGSEIVKVQELDKQYVDLLYIAAESLTQSLVVVKENKNKGEWPTKFSDDVRGKFSTEEADYALNLLVQAGWVYVHTRRDNVQYWRRPNKDNGFSATFGMFFNMFYIFSDDGSIEPFECKKGYSPYDILVKLQFSGDRGAAVSWLNDRYGVKPPPVNADIVDEIVYEKPEFPIEVFPASIQILITELNRCLNYSTDFTACAIMSAYATMNGNKYKLRVKNGWDAPTIFWFSIVGEPGVMKSHPIKTIIKPLQEIDKRNKVEYDRLNNEYKAIADKDKGNYQKPKFYQHVVYDSTLEALHDIHSYNTRGLLFYKDELVGLLNDMNKYRKGSDEQFWLESFNNASYIVNRVSKEPLMIENTNINIIGTIQPTEITKIMEQHGGNGLIDRFLYTSNESNIYPISFNDIDNKYLDEWYKCIETLNTLLTYVNPSNTEYIKFSPEALKIFVALDEQICELQKSEETTFQMKNYLNKMKTYAPRFALLMYIFDMYAFGYVGDILPDQMFRAAKIIDYFIKSATFIFNDAEKDTEIAEVSRKLDGKTKREKIIELYKKGFKQAQISKKLRTPASYVSKIISEAK